MKLASTIPIFIHKIHSYMFSGYCEIKAFLEGNIAIQKEQEYKLNKLRKLFFSEI